MTARRPAFRRLVVPLLSLALIPLGHQAASAAPADDIVWAVQPSSPDGPDARSVFEYSVVAGQQLHDYIGLSNLGTSPLELQLYATDALVTTDGAPALLPAEVAPVDIGTWVTFPAGTFTVEPGKRLDIPFTLTVPKDATPGDHLGGIVASLAPTQAGGEGAGIQVERRIGNRILLRVAGPVRPALVVESIKVSYDSRAPLGGMAVTYQVRNVGNVRLGADARVQVRGPFGIKLRTAPQREIAELGPGSSVTITQTLGAVAPVGRLSAEVTVHPVSPPALRDADAPSITRSATVWAIPWLLLGAGAVVVAAAVAIVKKRRRGRVAVARPTTGEGNLS